MVMFTSGKYGNNVTDTRCLPFKLKNVLDTQVAECLMNKITKRGNP